MSRQPAYLKGEFSSSAKFFSFSSKFFFYYYSYGLFFDCLETKSTNGPGLQSLQVARERFIPSSGVLIEAGQRCSSVLPEPQREFHQPPAQLSLSGLAHSPTNQDALSNAQDSI
ncbi:hypothetical protein J6590_024197 [Homalodisca vitripennis]|nr:hypothetical protein J6590_024197 [Homalodisca vitripennis]